MSTLRWPTCWHGIDAAHAAGLGPVKVNMVVKRGSNDDQIVPMARHFKGSPTILRFIEYMDVGASNGWNMDEVVPSGEVVRRIGAELPLAPVAANYTRRDRRALALSRRRRRSRRDLERHRAPSARIAAALRLSTEGKLYTCLFATRGHDLRALLRAGHDDLALSGAIASCGGRAPIAIRRPARRLPRVPSRAHAESKCPISVDNN